MSSDSIRWKITRAVRRSLLASKPNGLVRSLYKNARSLPFVRSLWRSIDQGGAGNLLDTAAYAKLGGLFADGAGGPARTV